MNIKESDIVRMTGEAGGFYATPVFLKRFAELVAAHEREECAKIVENADTPDCGGWTAHGIADAIRARSQRNQSKEPSMNLRYDMLTAAFDHGITKHAQQLMRELGITYTHSTPQSISDSWWFWNCQNVPKELPPYLTILKRTPHEAIGWGISEKEANDIVARSKA
jgi:hypothetical protein